MARVTIAVMSDQDSSEGKPVHSGLLYNFKGRLIQQQWIRTIAELDKQSTNLRTISDK